MDNKIQTTGNKQGITRNTVVGDVEIAEAEGSPINRDLGKANEITKDNTLLAGMGFCSYESA